MTQQPKLIQGLWPLPGGNKYYLHTLDQITKWTASASETTRDTFNAWLMLEYNVGENTVSGYLQVVTALGVLTAQPDGKLILSSFGKQILDADDQGKAKLVVERFMQNYLGFRDVLAIYARAGQPLHMKVMAENLKPAFPQWTSEAQFEYRALWLLSLGCLQQEKGRYYVITEFGRQVSEQFPPLSDISVKLPVENEEQKGSVISTVSSTDKLSRLILELEQAATDSQHPDRFEKAIGEAFEFLGFKVDQLGEAGDTDIVLHAYIGPESYHVIVDAKARKDGKLQDLEVLTLQDHQRKHQGEYAVVVAGRFAGGKIVHHAEENDIVLLSVPILCDWLKLHASTPLNLHTYRAILSKPGLLNDLPAVFITAADKRKQWGHLIVDLVELIQETYGHGLLQPLPSNELFTMMVTRLRGVRYSKQEVKEAVALLSHPAIQAAVCVSEVEIALAMNRQTLAQALRTLADQIEIIEAETQE